LDGDDVTDHRQPNDRPSDPLDEDDLPGAGLPALRTHRSAIAPSAPPATMSLAPAAPQRTITRGGPRRTAFVLSGGGARGAYEVGVLSWIFSELPRHRGGRVPRLDILCGTSVGAINACYLAAHAGDPGHGVRRLVELWLDLELSNVLGFGVKQAWGLPRMLLGGGAAPTGLFDVRPMAQLLEREVGWRAVSRNLRHGHLRALSISTTEVSTGRTVIWMQTGPDVALPATAPPRTLIRSDLIGTAHALASAAIPMLFPPVRLGREYYCDGGLRLNTPIAPALRLGATHVFAVALSREVKGVSSSESGPLHPRPLGAAALLGKVLNAFLLDHVVNDLDVLARINGLISDGISAYGDEFLTRVSETAQARGGETYRPVHCLAMRPSEDIGKLAADHVSRGQLRGGAHLSKQVLRALYLGGDSDADLASYVLFDGGFAKRLIDMGRADAAARRDEILAFFEGDEGIDPTRATREETFPMPEGAGSRKPKLVG
jgi:NTE family protein